MPGVSCLQPGWAHWTVCCLKGQGGELVVDTEEGLAMPAPAGRGTNQEAMEQTAACVQTEWHTRSPKDTDGNRGKCPERLWSRVSGPCTLPASPSLLADDPTASPWRSVLSCCEVIRASESGAQSPLVSTAVTEAGVEEREVVAEVLSRAGLGTLQSADLAAEPLPPGSSGRLWPWGLWPCRFWPQRRWCRSQSLC